ncbi:MAG: protein TolR [Magnetococcus sp. DMHC-6]
MSMGTNFGSGSERYRVMGEINVTPMVDIMLVLLIIFMVAAPLMNQGVEINLPDATANPLSSDEDPLIISVRSDGSTYIEKHQMTIDEVTAKVTAIKTNKPHLLVYLRGDSKTDYGTIMKVMAHLQQAGIVQVGLVTEPSS